MRKLAYFTFTFLVLSGCVSMQVASELQSGRKALQRGEPKAAISHFETVARLNPEYATDFTLLHVGISTYIGRTYYEMGDLKRAAENLERARRTGHNDVARLYYGLVLARTAKLPEGQKEVEAGLSNLRDFLDSLPGRFQEGIFWDLNGQLRGTATKSLEMIKGKDVESKLLLANVEWFAKKLDDEIDEVRALKRTDLRVSGDGGGGRGD